MSALTSLARAAARSAGRAQRITTVAHVHVGDRPLVFIPLAMAGEANAPLAALVGEDPSAPRLLVVGEPRNRDERFAFAAELALIVLAYLDRFRGATEEVSAGRGEMRRRFADAPQLLVPNPAGISFVRLLGRSTRFRRPDGEFPVHPAVPELGRWLSFLAERAEQPGSCLLLAVTDALSLHWASGQSEIEDLNLAALMGWIDPPPGLDGPAAAAAAEDPLTWPPAGPATDPGFDNEVLAALLEARARAAGETARRRAHAELERVVAGQLEPTWELMWRAVGLLRSLPAGRHVRRRWDADKDAFTEYDDYLRNGGVPQPRRDAAVAAARRLTRLERAQAVYAAQRAFDDPLVMAEYRMSGESFAGAVVAAEPGRVDSSGPRRRLRPRITVQTADPALIEPGTVLSDGSRAGQGARVVSVVAAAGEPSRVVLELAGGMGRSLVASPGSVPMVGEWVCYSTLTDDYQPPAEFPPAAETPWTHGGPPVLFIPADEDAVEEWS